MMRAATLPTLTTLLMGVLLALYAGPVFALKAALPSLGDVPQTESSPVDGEWRLSVNGKRIRIEAGRAWALDPWQHLLLWTVHPQMVVMKQFRRTAPGEYAADDLPLAGPSRLTLTNPRTLVAEVRGALGPAKFELTLIEANDPQALAAELGAASDYAEPADFEPDEAYEQGEFDEPESPAYNPVAAPPRGCNPIGKDPDTGMTICE